MPYIAVYAGASSEILEFFEIRQICLILDIMEKVCGLAFIIKYVVLGFAYVILTTFLLILTFSFPNEYVGSWQMLLLHQVIMWSYFSIYDILVLGKMNYTVFEC